MSIEDPRLGLPSASSMDRRWHCPGSHAAEKDLPDLKQEDVTDTGTRVHDALHHDSDEDLELSEKDIAARIKGLESLAVERWREGFKVEHVFQIVREERRWIHDNNLKPIASAQPDVEYYGTTLYGKVVALVLNYKTGFKEATPSERNWQCKTEALAVVAAADDHITAVRGGIVASRLYDKLDTTDYSESDIANIKRDIEFTSWKSQQLDAPRVPGEWCRWCKARGICTQASSWMMVATGVGVLPATPDAWVVASLVSSMSPEKLKRVWQYGNLFEQIIDGAEQRLRAMPEEQLALLGLKLAPGNKLKRFTNVTAAFERLEKEIGRSGMMDCISIARGKAADVFAEKRSIGKKEAQAEVDKILGDAIEEKEGNKKLKPL